MTRGWLVERLDDVLLLALVVLLLPIVILIIGAPIGLLAWLGAQIVQRW